MCCLFTFRVTCGESTLVGPNQLHALQRIFNKLPVSFQNLVIESVNLDLSIQDVQLFRVCFTFEPLLQDFPNDLQLLPSCHHGEVVSMAQSPKVSELTAKERQDPNSNVTVVSFTSSQHFFVCIFFFLQTPCTFSPQSAHVSFDYSYDALNGTVGVISS